jgi:hypothetical protein
MNLNTNLNPNTDTVSGANYIPPAPLVTNASPSNSTTSTIEKSEAIASLSSLFAAEIPVLSPPNSQDNVLALAVAAITGSGQSLTDFFIAMSQKQSEVADRMLDTWQQNLTEIAAQIQQLINSPQYIALQQIKIEGDQTKGSVSGIQGTTSANAAANSLASSVDRLQVLERLPATANIDASNASNQSTDSLAIPLTAIVMAGGAMTLVSGIETVASAQALNTHPFASGVEMVSKLQQIVPQISVSDMIPMVNLMMMAPIYFRSFEEATSNFKNNEAVNYTKVAQNYAKDVVKMVADPTFISQTIIGSLDSTTSLAADDQNRLTRMLKLILIGTALSLLYSSEVGKVQNNQFGGIEPEELRDLLLGNLNDMPSRLEPTQNTLYQTLVSQAKNELAMLNLTDRSYAVQVLFDYLGNSRDLNSMLDPAKVFHETLAASQYEHPAEALDQKAV